jgi:carbon monoxide dehydrogenase subunit G
MKVEQSFAIARPVNEVWTFFQNLPDVAACMPGASLTGETAPGNYAGKIAIRLGPFSASFEGEASVTFDQASRTGHAEGKGVDKRGGSRSKMTVDFDVTASGADATTVHIDADIVLSGAIAQFGRTGIIQETANILIGQFVHNLEARLAPPAPEPVASAPALEAAPEPPAQATASLNAGRLIVLVVTAWLRRLFGLRPAS